MLTADQELEVLRFRMLIADPDTGVTAAGGERAFSEVREDFEQFAAHVNRVLVAVRDPLARGAAEVLEKAVELDGHDHQGMLCALEQVGEAIRLSRKTSTVANHRVRRSRRARKAVRR